MTTATPATTGHRPAAVLATVGVLVFLGITALIGGTALVAGIGAPPVSWLDGVPLVDSWVVPGLVLALGFGVGSLVTSYGMARRPRWAWLGVVERLTRHHWSWAATIAIGSGQLAWIALELVYLPAPSGLQAVYGAVGAVLVALAVHPTVRAYLAAGWSR
jgi:hypothetical protein